MFQKKVGCSSLFVQLQMLHHSFPQEPESKTGGTPGGKDPIREQRQHLLLLQNFVQVHHNAFSVHDAASRLGARIWHFQTVGSYKMTEVSNPEFSVQKKTSTVRILSVEQNLASPTNEGADHTCQAHSQQGKKP